jgi:CubicO group peptidase (beta-lactamase class C family)
MSHGHLRRTLDRTTVLLAVTLWAQVAMAAQPDPGERIARAVDAFVAAEMRRQKVPGVAIGVVRAGKVIFARGYGEANVEHHVPVTRETVFQSGSVGKQFTAVAVMLEVEDGKLVLDDAITKYLPAAPSGWAQITIRNLLTHTSGVASYSSKDVNLRSDYSEDELLKMAYALPLEFEPGSRWSYSNTGYMLLGIILHRVSGKFYGDILRDRVFAPLGMKSARIISEADIVRNRSAGYQLVDGDLKNQDWVSPTLNTTADGALYLSLNDYLAWDRGLRAGALLRPESWSAIYTAVILKSGRTYPYGFGWEVDRALGEPWYYHGGSWQGFRTFISRYLADDLTVIVLANLADAMPDRFVDGITRVIDSRLPRLEPDREIADHNPEITERVRVLLRSLGAGTLSEVDLPAMRRDFFPEELQACKELLAPLTAPARLELLERRELGDDLRYSYLAVFPQRTLFVAMTLTPENQIADVEIEPR